MRFMLRMVQYQSRRGKTSYLYTLWPCSFRRRMSCLPPQEMTLEEDVKKLEGLDALNDEDAHIIADAILLQYVPKEIAEAYRKSSHRFWYS
jgi:hypothetical protein